jgi:hypothetical protein
MDAYLNELGVDQNARHALAEALTTDHPQLLMAQRPSAANAVNRP